MPTDSELAAIADPRLDQHFLVSKTKLAKLVAAADIRPTDHVLELGAGAGTVARALPRSASLSVVEFDARLKGFLQHNVPYAHVIHGDAIGLVRDLPCDVLIANLPHWVTEKLIAVLPDLRFRSAILAVGDSSSLERLRPEFTWYEIETITGEDFLPPQQGVSRLIKIGRSPRAAS